MSNTCVYACCHLPTYLDCRDLRGLVAGRREGKLQPAVSLVIGRLFRVDRLSAAVTGVEVEGPILRAFVGVADRYSSSVK